MATTESIAPDIGPFDVDVVIPVRNGARYIAYCLDSIKAQTRPVHAAIVVDYESADGTQEIVKDYMRGWPVLELIRAQRPGLAHGRNAGSARCRAPFVAFLDSDDVWEPIKLERQMALFSVAGPQVGFVHCSYYHIDDRGRHIQNCHVTQPKKRDDLLRDLLAEGNVISGSGSAVVVRRELLERAGGFDERLTYAEDWDAWLRLAEICDVDFVPEPLAGIRVHSKSMQHKEFPGKEEQFFFQQLLILDRWYGHPKFSPQVCKQYRWRAVQLANKREKGGSETTAKFYKTLRHCECRFGRELFSGPVDFFLSCYRMRLLDGVSKITPRSWARHLLSVALCRLNTLRNE
jgi:glycosyltransferase involved in cell wall biosynthesis